MRRFMVLGVALGLLTGACSQPPVAAPAKPDLASEEKAIREMDAHWLKAVQSRDAATEGAMLANDGIAYREHTEPLIGPAAYQAFETKLYADNPKINGAWTTNAVRLAESGDLAI